MTAHSIDASDNIGGGPSEKRLVDAVRRGFRLPAAVPVTITEVLDFTNINYVYRVGLPEQTFYLKVVPERPKHFPTQMSRERVFSEAEGLRRFRNLANGAFLVPEVLFIDREEMALAMSDVGEGRQVLFGVLPERFDLLAEQANALGHGLGLVHSRTRGTGSPRPPDEEEILRQVIFKGLLAPGAMQVFPETWPAVSAEMQAYRECLVHADLWSKNLLVRAGAPLALVDFEGVCYGDPAFDLGTLIAVALLPALEDPTLLSDALGFASRLLGAWESACGDRAWANAVMPRAFRATACFVSIRGFGPFPYSLSEPARQRIRQLGQSLAERPPAKIDDFHDRVIEQVKSRSDLIALNRKVKTTKAR